MAKDQNVPVYLNIHLNILPSFDPNGYPSRSLPADFSSMITPSVNPETIVPPVGKESHSGQSSSSASDVSLKSRSPLTPHCSPLFSRITKAAYDAGKAETVEAELRSASISAPKLIKAIRLNERLGYLDTQNLTSTELYELLNDHFHLSFKLRTFQDHRSK